MLKHNRLKLFQKDSFNFHGPAFSQDHSSIFIANLSKTISWKHRCIKIRILLQKGFQPIGLCPSIMHFHGLSQQCYRCWKIRGVQLHAFLGKKGHSTQYFIRAPFDTSPGFYTVDLCISHIWEYEFYCLGCLGSLDRNGYIF